MNSSPRRILLTGATGYVGRHLLPALLDAGHEVRCMTRDPDAEFPPGATAVKGDVISGDGLAAALAGCDVAFYLIHSMEAGEGSFAERDKRAARNFARAVSDAKVPRTIYLGGIEGEDTPSEHLRSRHEVASVLRSGIGEGEFVYARAAMIIGNGSASFEMVRYLVNRLPAMVCPRWIDTRTQPISIDDVVRSLTTLAGVDDVPGEAQLGGADVVTYREIMKRYALLTGRRAPLIVPVPVLTPRLSSYWVTFVTPLSKEIVQPLVEGLGTEMLVTEQPPPGINDEPLGFDEAVRAALGKPEFGAIVGQLSDETSTGSDGAVRSRQSAEIELPTGPAGRLWSDANLERLARTYWAFLTRWTLGLVRVHYTSGERYVCFVSKRLRLLTFAAPEYELEEDHASVRWQIKEGLLVTPGGRNGFLGIDVTHLGPGSEGSERVRVDVEVENFYPAIASRLSRVIYSQTQSRIHVLVTHGFLRRLVRRDLERSVTGRFA